MHVSLTSSNCGSLFILQLVVELIAAELSRRTCHSYRYPYCTNMGYAQVPLFSAMTENVTALYLSDNVIQKVHTFNLVT